MLKRLLWSGATVLALLTSAEIALRLRNEWKISHPVAPRLDALDRAYAAFVVQHVHPNYLFFFPLDAAARRSLGNQVCSLDADGFREPGPAAAGGRKLAFLLGGSVAFGDYASSNGATITSNLNRLQDEYFFVNAGVPSWNSTQSLTRLLLQISDLHPAVVVAFDGANDAALAGGVSPLRGTLYPAGTPENLDDLELAMQDFRSPVLVRLPPLFPEVVLRLRKYLVRPAPSRPDDDPGVEPAARQYLANQERMASLSRLAGARFVSVFQPVATLHHGVHEGVFEHSIALAAFHDQVVHAPTRSYEFHDFGSIFDQEMPVIPVAAPDLAADTIFVDEVHLSDRGNEMIAKRLLSVLK